MSQKQRASPKTVRWVHAVHRWTGLITGINVLILSLSGALLVFGQDILRLCSPTPEVVLTVDPAGPNPAQAVIDGLKGQYGGAAPGAVFQDKHHPELLGFVFRGPAGQGFYLMDKAGVVVRADQHTLDRVENFLMNLHFTLFLGVRGTFLLGAVAVLFLVSTGTGLYLYGPFMKQAAFGVIRWRRGVRRWSSDLHKSLGILSLVFNVVLGWTGLGLTVGAWSVRAWLNPEIVTEAKALPPTPADLPVPTIDSVMRRAAACWPGLDAAGVSYPSTYFGADCYVVYCQAQWSPMRLAPSISLVPPRGEGPATPVRLPWWAKVALFAAPLHFGYYGGLPVKAIYCLFGLLGGVITITGAIMGLGGSLKRWRGRRARRLSSRNGPRSP